MRSPADDIGPENVFGDRHYGWVGEDVEDGAVEKMRRADGIAVAAGGQGSLQQFVKVGPDDVDLAIIVDSKVLEKAIALAAFELFRRQGLRVPAQGGVEAEVAFHPRDVLPGGDRAKSLFHLRPISRAARYDRDGCRF